MNRQNPLGNYLEYLNKSSEHELDSTEQRWTQINVKKYLQIELAFADEFSLEKERQREFSKTLSDLDKYFLPSLLNFKYRF